MELFVLFLHTLVQLPKPDWVIVEARPSEAALHHSPSWTNSLYTPRGVFGVIVLLEKK